MKAFKEDKKIAIEDKPTKADPVMDKDHEDYMDRLEAQQLKQKCSMLLNRAGDSRKRYDWEWMVRDLFRRGYQFSKYNPSSRTVVLSTRSSVKVPINLVASQMRVVRNQVTSFRPKWEVIPNGTSEAAKANARYSQKVLDYYYDKLGFRKLNKEAITQGLMYSVGGPYQVVYSEEADNGKGDIAVWLTDPFDYYIDPYAQSQEDAEYCAKAVRRPLAEIKSNPNYKFYDQPITGDKRVAQSEYKQFLLMSLKQQSMGGTEEGEDEGVVLKEMWMKVRVTEDNQDKLIKELKKNDQDVKDMRLGETLMRVVTFLDSLSDPLKLQLLRRSDYPFVPYQADINPLEFYGEGWIKHVIPMNRVLNSLESSIFDYHYKFAKGRLVIDKNSGVRIVSNEHGSIIEKNKGAEVTALPIASLPQSYQMQIDNMRRYIEDIGGAHDVSLGRIPSGVKSGVGIAEMKAADATNQADLVDNLEDCLVKVAQKILKEISEHFDVPKIMKVLGKSGNPEHFAIVGEKAAGRRSRDKVRIGVDEFDLAVIGSDNEIRVTIGSWLAYTKDAQQDKLRELFQAGIIDQQTFLENAEFGDVQGIVERTRKEEMLKKLRGTPSQEGMPIDEEIAAQENNMLLREIQSVDDAIAMVQDTDNHDIHIIVHQEALSNVDDPIVSAHIAEHESRLGQRRDKVSRMATGAIPQGMGEIPGELPPDQMSPESMQGQEIPPMDQGQPVEQPDMQALMESLQAQQ